MKSEVLDTIKENKDSPELFHRIRQAAKNLRQGQPTVDDYRLVMQYPAITALFYKKP
jgi:hypothetical protein